MPPTPWLWAYWPVMKVARAGQQSGKESIASAKVVPCLASSRLTWGMNWTSVVAMSSVITTRMFGRPSLCWRTGRPIAGAAKTAASAIATSPTPSSRLQADGASMSMLRSSRIARRATLHHVSHYVNWFP